jgi:hypothetical protein
LQGDGQLAQGVIVVVHDLRDEMDSHRYGGPVLSAKVRLINECGRFSKITNRKGTIAPALTWELK